MDFRVNTNLDALTAYNALAQINKETAEAQLQLATRKRVNKVADDTSAFAVGKRLEAENLKMKAQLGNIAAGKNWLATAESALMKIQDKFNLIVAKQEDSKDPLKDITALRNDVKTLANEIENILTSTKIDGVDVLASAQHSFGAGTNVLINIGSYINHGQITQATQSFTASDANLIDNTIVGRVTQAISNVRSALGYIGNNMQTFDSREDFITTSISNNTANISRLFDADMAMAQLNATRGQIGSQIATSMLAQLNTAPQSILNLLR